MLDNEGNNVKDGEIGEVTITTLGMEAMPLIRYRTGDMSTLHVAPCACGRNTPRIGPIIGRDKHMIKYKGTTLFPNSIYEILNGNKDAFEKLLTTHFNLSDENTELILQQQNLPIEEVTDTELENYTLYKFLLSVRTYTLFGYFTSEKVGEEVLNYDPVPGRYVGCIPAKNLPNQRDWSL